MGDRARTRYGKSIQDRAGFFCPTNRSGEWQHASVLPPIAIYNSTCSEMRKASSTSMPRYRTVDSSLCPAGHKLDYLPRKTMSRVCFLA